MKNIWLKAISTVFTCLTIFFAYRLLMVCVRAFVQGMDRGFRRFARAQEREDFRKPKRKKQVRPEEQARRDLDFRSFMHNIWGKP